MRRNLWNAPLATWHHMRLVDIFNDSEYLRLSYTAIGDVRDKNRVWRSCEFVDRCIGGCKRSPLATTGSYHAADPSACYFFKHGWKTRIHTAAQPTFEDYVKRNSPARKP